MHHFRGIDTIPGWRNDPNIKFSPGSVQSSYKRLVLDGISAGIGSRRLRTVQAVRPFNDGTEVGRAGRR